MIFKNVLIEHVFKVPLKKWNDTQADIWGYITKEYNIDSNNIKIFSKSLQNTFKCSNLPFIRTLLSFKSTY